MQPRCSAVTELVGYVWLATLPPPNVPQIYDSSQAKAFSYCQWTHVHFHILQSACLAITAFLRMYVFLVKKYVCTYVVPSSCTLFTHFSLSTLHIL